MTYLIDKLQQRVMGYMQTSLTSLLEFGGTSLYPCFPTGFDRWFGASFLQARLGMSPFCPCNLCSGQSMCLSE